MVPVNTIFLNIYLFTCSRYRFITIYKYMYSFIFPYYRVLRNTCAFLYCSYQMLINSCIFQNSIIFLFKFLPQIFRFYYSFFSALMISSIRCNIIIFNCICNDGNINSMPNRNMKCRMFKYK